MQDAFAKTNWYNVPVSRDVVLLSWLIGQEMEADW